MYVFIKFFPMDVISKQAYLELGFLFGRGLKKYRESLQWSAMHCTRIRSDEYPSIVKPNAFYGRLNSHFLANIGIKFYTRKFGY